MKHLKWLLSLTALLSSALAAPTVLSITATGKGYAAPASVQAGYVQVNLKNSSKAAVDIGFFRLKPGVTLAQFRAVGIAVATEAAKDAGDRLNQLVEMAGGVRNVAPGTSNSVTLHLRPGKYVLASLTADDTTHKTAISDGYLGSLTVTGPALNNPPPAADYRINMVDYRFVLPTHVMAGTHTWHILNSGKELHYALLAKLLPGKTMKDAMKSLMGRDQSAPPPVDFQHSTYSEPVTKGQAEDVTWTLGAGDYVVVCFIMNKNGVPHAQMGMAQELVVK